MTISKIVLVMLVTSVCSGCINSQRPKETVTGVSALIYRSSDLDAQLVSVRGWIEIEPETYRFWDSRAAMDNGHDQTQCVGVVLPQGINRAGLDRSEVVVQGTFVSDVSGKYLVLGGCQVRRFILVERIQRLEDR